MPVSLFHFFISIWLCMDCLQLYLHILLLIWLAAWADKMNQILYSSWLPGQARWLYLALVFFIPLTMLVWSRWMDLSLYHACLVKMDGHKSQLFFCLFMDLNSVSKTYKHKLKSLGQYPVILTSHARSINHMYTLRWHVSSFSWTFFLFLASFSTLRENAFSCSLIYMQKKFRNT